jgi:hypothetical protein
VVEVDEVVEVVEVVDTVDVVDEEVVGPIGHVPAL